MPQNIKAMSLFANVGIAETYLSDCGIDIVVANEIDPARSKFYQHLYPETDVITGDIANEEVFAQILESSRRRQVDFVIATPPCQGMSLAGKRDPHDERNQLIFYAIKMIQELKPKYVLLENVPQLLKTEIHVREQTLMIPEYIHQELEHDYNFAEQSLVSAMDYEVPQMRRRNIFLLSRKDLSYVWQMPAPKPQINLRKALYHLPSVDPMLREGMDETLRLFPDFYDKKEQAEAISKYHHPPVHAKKHVIAMMHTPTGETAFHNPVYYPKKDNGDRVNGHYNTYRRFEWDKPARTITQNNGVISSLCCVHPGKCIGRDADGVRIFSDARCLTIYELLIVFSLPTDWNIPEWAEDRLVRQVIGEGIPPMLVKNLALELARGYQLTHNTENRAHQQ